VRSRGLLRFEVLRARFFRYLDKAGAVKSFPYFRSLGKVSNKNDGMG